MAVFISSLALALFSVLAFLVAVLFEVANFCLCSTMISSGCLALQSCGHPIPVFKSAKCVGGVELEWGLLKGTS